MTHLIFARKTSHPEHYCVGSVEFHSEANKIQLHKRNFILNIIMSLVVEFHSETNKIQKIFASK